MRQWIVPLITLLLAHAAIAAVPKKINSFPEGEKLIYSKFLASFRKGDMNDMVKQKKLLEDNYPFSAHLDNIYYLIGAYEYGQDHLGEALRAFDKVINKYPQSSRRSSALFAMAMTYKKLNLTQQAQAVFSRIIDTYPGSPEAQRAWMEARLAAAEQAKSKKSK
jgi:TolA-binding protein